MRSKWSVLRVWLMTVCGLAIAGGLAAPAASAQASDENAVRQDDNKDEKKEEKKDEKKGLTLKPDRKIEFTTDEGTWLSLDVSPDGKTIVFELLGDLYTLPIEGGQAKPLTKGMAFDSQPRYSPDGQWIAFISDRDGADDLYIMKADGSGEPKQLSKDQAAEFVSPAWTPDGQYVIVSKAAGLAAHELWMYHIQGGSGVQITKSKATPTTPRNERHNAMGVSVSPDGRYLYYARRLGGFQYNAMFPLWSVARRDRRTGDEDILVRQLGSAFRPMIAPDGKTLIYATRYETKTGLRIRNLESGEDRWLKYPVQRDDQESRFTRDLWPGYAFVPGGKEILYTTEGKIHRLNIASGDDRLIPFTAQVSQEIGPKLDFPQKVEGGPVKVRLIQDPAESPDGKKLAFSALTHLYVMDIPGGKPQRVTPGSAREFQPAWSPDGQWLAYVTWSSAGGDIWKVRAGAGEPQKLTGVSAFYSDVVWSPDGARIVALRGSAYDRENSEFDFGQTPGTELIWLPAEGGAANLILPARGAGKPHFTQDKDRIYLYTRAGLMSLRYDGTDRRVHLQVKSSAVPNAEEPVPAGDVRVSPDGHWVLAHIMNQLYLTAMPEVGGEAPTVLVNSASVPVKRLTDIGADYFGWADDGKTLTWAIGPSFFRQPFSAISFEPPKPEEKKDADKDKKDAEKKDGEKKDEKKEEKKEEQAAEKKKESFKEQDKSVQEIAVDLEFPRKTPRGTMVLRGATVVTMKGDEIVKDADIVVKDNRIESVGKRGAVPAGATVFDVKGKTIVPGFVDTHAHWFEIRRGILDTQNWNFLANLAYGVTSGLDVQTATNDMFAYQDLVDTGDIIGLRPFSTGPGIFSDNNFQSEQEVEGVLTRYKKYYRTHNLKSYVVGNRKQRQWMVEACKKLEMMPTTEGALDLKLNLTHVIDGFHGNEHTLPIAPLEKDVVQMFAQSGIGETPTLIVAYGSPWGENIYYENTEVHDDAKLNHFTPHNIIDEKTKRRPFWFRKDEYSIPQLAAGAVKILRAGGRVGIGGHGQLQGLGYHWEMWNVASGGATPMEVLRAATILGAQIAGYAQDIGSIEPGKLADLVILDKSPLDDIHNTNTVRWVMKNGELFEGDTLNQVWPEKKPLEPLWFWNSRAPGEKAPGDAGHLK
jgi:Tol biopolymer transport system component/imidazolonepropionase-like amidohydrolase